MPSTKPKRKKQGVAKLKEPRLEAVTRLEQLNIEDPAGFLSDSSEDDSSEKKIAKELFSSQGLKTRTDIDDRQIVLLSKAYFLGDLIDNDHINKVLDNFIELRVSRKRKSRAEFIEALKGMDEFNQQAGVFNRLGGMFSSK